VTDWPEDELELGEHRWLMAPAHLLPRERWLWWQQLWSDVLALGERYRIRPARGWWEDGVRAEALAVLAGWVERSTAASGMTRPASSRSSTTSNASAS
jgi:hypothetical protein